MAILFAAATVILAGCSDDPDRGRRFSAEEPLRIALVGPAGASERWDYVARGAIAFARSLGTIEVTPTGPTTVQADGVLASWTGEPPLAVVMWVDDPAQEAAKVLEVGRRYGIVITVGGRVDGAWGHVQIAADDGAELLADALPRLLGERRTYVLAHSARHGALDETVYLRFLDRARMHFTLTCVANVDVSARPREQGIDALRDALTTFPSTGLAVVLASQVVLAARPEQVQGLPCPLAVGGTSPGLWGHLGSGKVTAMVGPVAGDIGRTAVQMALDAYSPEARPGDFRVVPVELVTLAGLGDFARRYAAAAGLPVTDLLPRPVGPTSRP